MTSFGPYAQVLGVSGAVTPVVFSWIESNFNSDTHVIVEVAQEVNFRRIVKSADVNGASTVSIPLENGNYRWRAYPAQGGNRAPINAAYPYGVLEIISADTAVLLSPADKAEIAVPGKNGVFFSWTTVQGTSAYLLEISANAGMENPVVILPVEWTSVSLASLELGDWHWRVIPVFPDWFIGSLPPSTVRHFTLSAVKPQTVEYQKETESQTPIIAGTPSVKSQDKTESQKTANSKTTAVKPQEKAKTSAAKTDISHIIFNRTEWGNEVYSGDKNTKDRLFSDISVERETIQGQEKDVITFITNLSQGNAWRKCSFTIGNDIILQKLKEGQGIRFKILGDGGKDWLLNIATVITMSQSDFPHHRMEINTPKNEIVEVNIPYSRLKSPDWGTKSFKFIKNDILFLEIQREALDNSTIGGTSAIKIFDFEIY